MSLLNASSQIFDILTVDAFSGDAVPLNLVTLEATNSYFEHLTSDGALVLHVTSRYFALTPIIGRAAEALNLSGAYSIKRPSDDASIVHSDKYRIHWKHSFGFVNGWGGDYIDRVPMVTTFSKGAKENQWVFGRCEGPYLLRRYSGSASPERLLRKASMSTNFSLEK